MQRLRVRFAKRGRLRFTSHRDFQRAFERALRRAGVPIAYSQGFTPHPKVSYAGAAPTGAASEAEYLEIAVTRQCDPAALAGSLDAALPAGLDVVEVVEATHGSLADRLEASDWELRLPGLTPDAAAAAAAAFLESSSIEVQRMTKNGVRTLDARAAVVRLAVTDRECHDPPCAILRVVVRHGPLTVRPDDVLAGLRSVADFAPPQSPLAMPLVTRLAQGPLDEQSGTVGDPLEPDRDAAHPGRADAEALAKPADA
ncbi:MAG: TIGR03936 family radical SAM-associated protein [Jiangellaceae bacterium]